MRSLRQLAVWMLGLLLVGPIVGIAAEPKFPTADQIEVLPADAKQTKIVLIAGSNAFKPGEHEYVAGCALLADLLKQTPGVAPVLALDWPKKPETLAGAKSVVMLFDGGDKHGLLKDDRLAQIQKLSDNGVGFVCLHQLCDVPKDLGERTRGFIGGTFEKGHSSRAHWVNEFKTFADHPVSRGVTPFKIDDGYLFKLRFVPEMKGITPLLKTVSPKAASQELTNDSIVAWLYDRPTGGRSFTFTGTHLHASYGEAGYRRFLVNGILWTAGVEIPTSGAPVNLATEDVSKYLKPVAATAAK